MAAELVLPTLAVGALMGWFHWRHRSKIKEQRNRIFAKSLSLFQSPNLYQDDVNFPVLKGKYRGEDFRLDLIADHLAYRKLPSLWLQVTLPVELALEGALSFLARPEHPLYFSFSERFENELELPRSWFQKGVLTSDNPDAVLPLEKLAAHIELFSNTKYKELLITPRGIRLVYQLNQAQKAHYQILRGCVFDNSRVDEHLARDLMDQLINIKNDLKTRP